MSSFPFARKPPPATPPSGVDAELWQVAWALWDSHRPAGQGCAACGVPAPCLRRTQGYYGLVEAWRRRPPAAARRSAARPAPVVRPAVAGGVPWVAGPDRTGDQGPVRVIHALMCDVSVHVDCVADGSSTVWVHGDEVCAGGFSTPVRQQVYVVDDRIAAS